MKIFIKQCRRFDIMPDLVQAVTGRFDLVFLQPCF